MMSFLRSPGASRWRPSGSSNTTGSLGKISKSNKNSSSDRAAEMGGGGGGGMTEILRPTQHAQAGGEPRSEVIRSLTSSSKPATSSESSEVAEPLPISSGGTTTMTPVIVASSSPRSTAVGPPPVKSSSSSSAVPISGLPPLSRTVSLQITPTSKASSVSGRSGPASEVIRISAKKPASVSGSGLGRTTSLGSSASERRDMTTGSSRSTTASFVSSVGGGGADSESDDPSTPRSRSMMAKEFAELALQQQRLPAGTRDLQASFERGQSAAEAAYVKLHSESAAGAAPPTGKGGGSGGGAQQGVNLLNSLRKKLIDMEQQQQSSGTEIVRKEDVSAAARTAEGLLSQWALRESEIQHEKMEVRKMAALFKQANEDAKRMVEEARKIAQEEIAIARDKVKRAEEIARDVMASKQGEAADPEMEKLKKEVIEARRIKMLHQPTMVSHLELQVTGLQKGLLAKSQDVVKLRREMEVLKNPRKRMAPFKLDGLEFLGTTLSILPTAPEGQLPYPCEIQWYRVHKEGRVESIAGATAASYSPEPLDVECQLRATLKYGPNSRKLEIMETSGPLDPCPGLDQFVDLLYTYGTAHFNVVVLEQTPFSGGLLERKATHILEIYKDRVKLRKGRGTKVRDPYTNSMQLGGARGGGESAAQSVLWQTRGKEFLLQMDSERERNAAIMLARRFASECKSRPPGSGESDYSSDTYGYTASESGSVRG